jgi:transcription initiation factor IIE alpha subunit
MAVTIAALGRDGPPSKVRDGRSCFLCPRCGEMLAYINPRTNLAHGFACHANWNNLDLLLACGHEFRSAVAALERLLARHEARRPRRTPPVE